MSRHHSAREPTPRDGPTDDAPPGPEVAETARPAAELEAELAEVKDRLLRALAEQENIRRRAQRELRDAVKFAADDVVKDLLATADNLTRAIGSAPGEKTTDETVRQWLAGIEATERALLESFDRHGIRRFNPLGEAFDPNRHQAMLEVADDQHPAGTVVQVIQPGYFHHDRLLRPAMVGVAKDRDEPPAAPK
jgi:molecular chaperone GrpE